MDEKTLRTLLEKGKLEPYIRHIRFPQYKNINPFTKIDFTFPITAIVGANGTNKSSLLRALYGSPGSNNLGNYWFSTKIDTIEEGAQFPNCFIYGYYNSHRNKVVEVLKTRIKKENDPDYWEPSRALKSYNMEPFNREDEYNSNDPNALKTRWRTIKKNVEIIDFRHGLSSFDRYFYYGDYSKEQTFKEKKLFIRRRSPHLKKALDKNLLHSTYCGTERIVDEINFDLSDQEVTEIGTILGRNYHKISLIRHLFFQLDGYTARIYAKNQLYTEAFAGSGEFAVIMIVSRIMRTSEKSLILLDEPEVSLHPGAQERLLDFMVDQIKKHKHQIIFTTHSPAMIRGLPSDAIKVLDFDDKTSQVILVSQESLPEEAFIKIGEPISGKKLIIVEDKLAREIIIRSLRLFYPQLLKLVDIKFFPGGASVIFNHYIPPYAEEDRKNVCVILDGDQTPASPWPNALEIDKLDSEELRSNIENLSGSDIKFPKDSGPQEIIKNQITLCRKKFLNWCGKYVAYLPSNLGPEEFVLQKTNVHFQGDAKLKFVELTRESLGLLTEESPSSEQIFAEQQRQVAKIPIDDQDMKLIADTVKTFCG